MFLFNLNVGLILVPCSDWSWLFPIKDIAYVIDLLYCFGTWTAGLWKERLLQLLKQVQRCDDDVVVSPESMSSDYCLFSLRGGEERGRTGERGGEDWGEEGGGVEKGRRGQRQRESGVENGGVGAAIMMEKQYCGNIAGQFCQLLYSHSSGETS